MARFLWTNRRALLKKLLKANHLIGFESCASILDQSLDTVKQTHCCLGFQVALSNCSSHSGLLSRYEIHRSPLIVCSLIPGSLSEIFKIIFQVVPSSKIILRYFAQHTRLVKKNCRSIFSYNSLKHQLN